MKKIILIGDSLIRCSNLKNSKKWTNILKKKFAEKNYNYKFYNFSINGITTEELLSNKKLLNKYEKINYLLISIGTNDSVYWKSRKGNPRISINKFKENINVLFTYLRTLSIENIIVIIPHLFAKKTKEINNKTHNQNIIFYKKNLVKYAKLYKINIINMTKHLRKYNRNEYCENMPDGIHLNSFGSHKYFEIIYNYMNK